MACPARPSKPAAVLTAVAAVGMGLFASTSTGGLAMPFLLLWTAVLVGVAAVTLWSAFGRTGHEYRIEPDDDAGP